MTVEKPWGSYTVFDEGDGWLLKKLIIKPGHQTSLQLHQHRNETWFVVQGYGAATIVAPLDCGESIAMGSPGFPVTIHQCISIKTRSFLLSVFSI